MNPENERIEQYLKGVVPPEPELEPHRRQLRQRILGRIQQGRTTAARGKAWRLAAVALVLTAAVAAAVGVTLHRYHFEGRDQDGKYLFSTGPQTVYQATHPGADGNPQTVTVTRGTGVSLGSEELNPAGIEETQKELEEIDRLRQQDCRELVRVIDTEVNGRSDRTCVFRYALANGRTQTVAEGDPDRDQPPTPSQIEQDQQEIAYLPPQGGESLGNLDRQMYGQTFTFERWQVALSDGTVVTLADGEIKGPKTSPAEVDWAELRRLSQEGAGEFLGTYEEPIRGQVYTFERRRFVLSDGTEVIRATGEPKGDPPVPN